MLDLSDLNDAIGAVSAADTNTALGSELDTLIADLLALRAARLKYLANTSGSGNDTELLRLATAFVRTIQA